MKIVCDACQAKYSISDDKVQGKVFKIRCKKCSNIIVVRGGAGASEAAPAPQEKDTRVYDYGYEGTGGGAEAAGGDDAVWHLVINQDQVGPLTVAEVQQRFASGEVDGETFTWREGFADWLPLSQVDAFAALVASGSTTTAGSASAAVSSMFGSGDDLGTSRSDPGDLFAAASSPSARGGRGGDDDGGDLFGSKPAASSAAAQSAAGSKLRGERNENSVLFSLNNLAQLASDSPRPAPSSSSGGGGGGSSSAGHATGAAGGEGSGLIDIRSMASAYMGGGGGGATVGKPVSSSAIGSIDDLPVFGGGGFSEPAVIVPTARASANNKMLYLMIGAVGLLAVVAIVMVVLMLKGGDKGKDKVAVADPTEKAPDKEKAAEDKTGEKPSEPAGSAAEKAPAGDSAAVAKAEPEKKEPEKAPVAEKKEPEKHETKTASKGGSSATKTTTPTKNTTTTVTKNEPPPKKEEAAAGGCDEVSCVLNNYEGTCCAKFRKAKGGGGGGGGGGGTATTKGSDLPEGLDRAMISNGIAAVKARVTSCGDKSPAKGKVKVKVVVGPDGKVSGVTVETTPDQALGTCVGAAVQKASFSKTQKGGSFSYPFVF